MNSSPKILITGARAPVALELARHFGSYGARVFAADSLSLPPLRASRTLERYTRVPAPRRDPAGFVDGLNRVIRREAIDLVIPTCEEAFYVSRYRGELLAPCLVAPLEVMRGLHSKRRVLHLAQGCGLRTPETTALLSEDALEACAPRAGALVFKREYSRFATGTLIAPSRERVRALEVDPANPWVAQSLISGREICTYSVCVDGEVRAHAAYRPRHRVGLGSGIYFEPVEDPRILDFVRAIAKKTDYHGQIGFDLMDDGRELHLLECNPRATSGAHLFQTPGALASAILDPHPPWPEVVTGPLMVAPAMLAFRAWTEWRAGRGAQFMCDYRRARDVVANKNDMGPSVFQFAGLGELLWRGLKVRRKLTSVATADIEWNGEEL